MRFRDLRPAERERLKTRLMALKKTIGLEASGNDIPSSIRVKKSGDLPLPPSALVACLLRALAQKALVQNGFEAATLQAEKTAATRKRLVIQGGPIAQAKEPILPVEVLRTVIDCVDLSIRMKAHMNEHFVAFRLAATGRQCRFGLRQRHDIIRGLSILRLCSYSHSHSPLGPRH